jgi:hypothetical protein
VQQTVAQKKLYLLSQDRSKAFLLKDYTRGMRRLLSDLGLVQQVAKKLK